MPTNNLSPGKVRINFVTKSWKALEASYIGKDFKNNAHTHCISFVGTVMDSSTFKNVYNTWHKCLHGIQKFKHPHNSFPEVILML